MMNKIFSIVLALVFMNPSFASYLDDWTNDDLCGWMNSATAPEHIQKEVDKRGLFVLGVLRFLHYQTQRITLLRMVQFFHHQIHLKL